MAVGGSGVPGGFGSLLPFYSSYSSSVAAALVLVLANRQNFKKGKEAK